MPGPAPAGVLIYAKHLEPMARFYERLLGMRVLVADAEHCVLESDNMQLVLHAIPPHLAAEIRIATPPEPRERQAIKPFFSVENLGTAEALAATLGGSVYGPTWQGPGFEVRNVCDPEGNILHLRQFSA